MTAQTAFTLSVNIFVSQQFFLRRKLMKALYIGTKINVSSNFDVDYFCNLPRTYASIIFGILRNKATQ